MLQPQSGDKQKENIVATDTQISNEYEKDIALTECPRCGCDSYSSQICNVCAYDFSWEDEDDRDDELGNY